MKEHMVDGTLKFMYLVTDKMDTQKRVGLSLVELGFICDKLNLIIERLLEIRENLHQIDDINQIVNQIDHSLDWCAFLLEDFLYRKYVVRERVWSVLESTLQVSRGKGKNGVEKFVKNVENTLNVSHPSLASAFVHLQKEIDADVRMRNVSIHNTMILPIVASPPTVEYVVDDRPVEVQAVAAKQAIIDHTISQQKIIQEFIEICQNWISEFELAFRLK